jgi:hypothetical protein
MKIITDETYTTKTTHKATSTDTRAFIRLALRAKYGRALRAPITVVYSNGVVFNPKKVCYV